MTLNDLATVGGLAVVVTIIVQLFKGFVTERWVPLFAVGVGVAVSMLAAWALGMYGWANVGQAMLTGLLAGATAIGIYEVAPRNVLGPKA